MKIMHLSTEESSMTEKFAPPTKCLKCGAAMELGLGITKDMAQLSDDYVFEDTEPVREHWQKAEKADGKFLGRQYQGYRKVGPRLIILHYRCVDCGYLESYAPVA
jgi:hypothetical protein